VTPWLITIAIVSFLLVATGAVALVVHENGPCFGRTKLDGSDICVEFEVDMPAAFVSYTFANPHTHQDDDLYVGAYDRIERTPTDRRSLNTGPHRTTWSKTFSSCCDSTLLFYGWGVNGLFAADGVATCRVYRGQLMIQQSTGHSATVVDCGWWRGIPKLVA
jgi:hypothetical protein